MTTHTMIDLLNRDYVSPSQASRLWRALKRVARQKNLHVNDLIAALKAS